MLKDLISGAPGRFEQCYSDCGIICYAVDIHPEVDTLVPVIPEGWLEALFCSTGELRVGRDVCTNRQILLLSGCIGLRVYCAGHRLQGILVCADLSADNGLRTLFAGSQISAESVSAVLGRDSGVMVFGQNTWSEAVFTALRDLPGDERGGYCAAKSAELLYLLCRRSERAGDTSRQRYRDPYLVDTVRRVHTHMLCNLGEKLTISSLASEFHIAPTSFKECFRELYGQSVHAYLLNLRMERAAELLRTTDLAVFQIAESVGYGSASQFGVEFKRRYSLPPLAYRKRLKEKNV